jgi:hypothetical protein
MMRLQSENAELKIQVQAVSECQQHEFERAGQAEKERDEARAELERVKAPTDGSHMPSLREFALVRFGDIESRLRKVESLFADYVHKTAFKMLCERVNGLDRVALRFEPRVAELERRMREHRHGYTKPRRQWEDAECSDVTSPPNEQDAIAYTDTKKGAG